MECSAAEATGLSFVCFVAINPRVLSANRVEFGFFFHKLSNLALVARVCYCLFFVFSFGVSDYSVRDYFTPIFFIEISFVLPPPPLRPTVHQATSHPPRQVASNVFPKRGGPTTPIAVNVGWVFTSVRKKTVFLDKSSKTLDI